MPYFIIKAGSFNLADNPDMSVKQNASLTSFKDKYFFVAFIHFNIGKSAPRTIISNAPRMTVPL